MKKRIIKLLLVGISYSAICLFYQVFFVSIMLASGLEAQQIKSVKEVPVKIELNHERLIDVFHYLEKNTDFIFVYDKEDNFLNQRINLQGGKTTVENVLLEISKHTKLRFKQINNSISVKKVDKRNNSVEIIIQGITITGKVTSFEDNQGLPGVNVIVKGTDQGTVTDIEGNYSVHVPDEESILIFSSVGYVQEKVVVGNQTVINFALASDIAALEEIVIVGYGTQQKENLTGAVGVVDMKVMDARPVRNATQMLQGTVPGLNIKNKGGGLDSNPDINIRGIATIGQGSTGSPLILIDGMEGNINAINPQDIDNISVLKDAAASSIYGSRAPFGVILITTKKGKRGKVSVNYNNNFRWSRPIEIPDMMNSFQFATYFNDAQFNGGAGPHFTDERLQRIKDFMDGKITETTIVDDRNGIRWDPGYRNGNDNVDWYEALFEESFGHEHNISANGGSDAIQYYISGNYLDQDGFMVFNKDNFKRYATTIRVSADLGKYVKLNFTNRFIREDNEKPTKLTNTMFRDLARQGWPVLPLYDPNGFLFDSPAPALGLRDGGDNRRQVDRSYSQGQLVVEPVKNWKTFVELNYRTRNTFQRVDMQQTYNHDIYGNPYLYDRESRVYEYARRANYYSTNIYSEYSKNLTGGHYFKAMIGFQAELNKFRDLSARRQGIILPGMPVLDLTTGTDFYGDPVVPEVTGQYQNWATTGYFGRINYNFKERYLFELNMRYDGTSRFRSDKRWQLFPSFSAGWNVANEAFFDQLSDKISVLKVRGSYGELGNQNTRNFYPTYVTLPTGTSDGIWLLNGLRPNTSNAPGLVSQFLTWERVKSWNIGVDVRMLEGRLSTTFDYFTRITNDMVGPAPELPVILGTSVPKVNNTDLKTTGFEFDVTWNDRLSNGLGYNVRFLLSDSKTKITKYPNPTGALNTYREGQMMGEIWGLETIGIAKTQEEMDSHLAGLPNGDQTAIGSQWGPGDLMWADLNGDGKIDKGAQTEDDHGDLKIIGNNTPRYSLGFNIGADWKGFDISAFFQGILKRDYFQGGYYFWGAQPNKWWSTGFVQHLDYFRADPDHPLGQNLDSYYPRPIFGGVGSKNPQTQSRYVQDASYMRLKNLQIGYTLPTSLMDKIRVQNMRVYFSGENLWTMTNMTKIFDPETIGEGWGGNVYPLSSIYSMGLSITL
ncbi:MAG: TonB-dependent receptor [Cytophagales bacterium]|nr:TonB-dependent receptor [Cytophagales bacterium]